MSQQKKFDTMTLEPGAVEEVFVGHITDPDNFYVQLARTAENLEDIMSLLTSHYQNSPKEKRNWQLGDACAALYTDGEWYRGKITGTPHNNERVEVTFVDYGNKDYIEVENIRLLHRDLFATPVMSFRCCLEGVSSAENFWSPEHVVQFEDLALEKDFTASIIAYDSVQDTYRVQLIGEDGENINKKFGQMTKSQVIQASSSTPERSVQASDGLDLKVTVKSGAQPKPARGIARALGVNMNGGASPQSAIPHIELKVGEKTNVTVVFVSTPSEFWCQVSKYAEATSRLAEQMAMAYSSMGPGEGILHNLRPGSVCAALCEADETWYRATVEKVSGPKASVFFLDYGNTDTVSVGNVKELKEEFRSLPAQAVSCGLKGVAPSSGEWTEHASAAFEDMVMEHEYTATVIEKSSGRHFISLIDCADNCNVASTFLKNCPEATQVNAAQRSTPAADAASLAKYQVLKVPTPTRAEVVISWVETPGEFYVQLAENMSVLESLTDGLQELYESTRATAAIDVRPGSMVVAKFSEDEAWYRSVVKSISGCTSEVEFVDFGNCDKVPTNCLKQLEKQFSRIPAQAVRCSLSGVRPLSQGNTWSGDAKDFLERLTENDVTCRFLSCKGGVYEVDLESEGKNITKEMIAHAVVRGVSPEASGAGPKFQQYQFVQLAKGRPQSVYVGFVESVESFFVQLSEGMSQLDDLMEELQGHYDAGKGKPLRNPQVGMPCAAKYEEDGLWYRAQVRSFTARDIDVFFVDYGNTQSAPQNTVLQMEPNFVTKLKAQAVQCRLDMAEARNAEAQLDKFNAFTGEEELELVVKAQEGSKIVVDLLKAGVSVTDELRGAPPAARESPEKIRAGYTSGKVSPGQTVSAFASFIESPSRFWIQLAGCDDELTSMMETLSKHYGSGTEPALANPTPGQPCVALYDEDKQWYRASVMSVHGTEVKVQFVDYGNSELVDRQSIKPISSAFMTSPLLAIECCLDGFQSCPAPDDVVLLLENLVSEQELFVTFRGPKNVIVKAGNKNVAQVLQEQGFGPKPQKLSPQPKSSPGKSSLPTNPQNASAQLHLTLRGRPGFGASSPPSNAPLQKFKEASPPSGSAAAIITHLDNNSGMFWVQLLSSESQLEQLASRLQAVYGSGGPALQGPPEKGMVCCAKFSIDGCWYRSVIENVSAGRVQVQFVDYGNSDIVPTSSLRSITPDLLTAPVQVFACKLKGLQSWNAQTAKAFSKTALDEQLNVRFVTSASPFEIQVSVNGQDLLQLLLKSPAPSPQKGVGAGVSRPSERTQQSSPPTKVGFGSAPSKQFNERPKQRASAPASEGEASWDKAPKRGQGSRISSADSGFSKTPSPVKTPEQVFQSQQTPKGEEAAYVSHVADDGTFYLQLVKDIDAIDGLTSKVRNAAPGRHPNLKVGAACGAKFSEDDAWYRGIITSISGSSAEITFVDFGNGEKCALNSLKPLPAQLLTPPLAYHCQVEEIGLLTPEQQEAFKSASEDQEYQVTFKRGSPFRVIMKDESGTNLASTVFKQTTIRPAKAPTEMVPATVSEVGENGRFFLQLCSEEDALAIFIDEVQTECERQTEKLSSYEEGQICCAKFSKDESWYRASILKVSGDVVTILFVDYGNTDTVAKDDLLVLPQSLMAKPAFAYDCRLHGVKKWKEDQKKKFDAMTDGKIMNARFLSSQPPYEVELTRSIGLDLAEEDDADEPENTEMAEASADAETVEAPADTEAAEEEFTDAKESPEAEGAITTETQAEPGADKPEFPAQTPPALDACVISHVDSNGIFYIQLISEDENRNVITEKLQDACESPDCKILPPSVNLACCAKFSEDEAWYRAAVEKVEGENVDVRFVDFGNTDSIPASDVKELSAENLSVPPLAYQCVLEGCELDMVSSKLEELTLDQTLTVTFRTTEHSPYTVNLQLENGTDVSTLFLSDTDQNSATVPAASDEETTESVDENAATDVDRKCVSLNQGHRMKVTISHVISPSLFYVQRDDKLTQLDELAETLLEHYSSLAEGDGLIENLAVDQICASLFGEDEDKSWYRAVVQSIDADTDSCELFYVDYGNSDLVPRSSVRELPAEFQTLPWQCVSCSLAGVRCQGDEWSEEVNDAFQELAESKSVLVDTLSGDGITKPYLVHVLDLGISMATSLLALNLPGVEAAEMEELDRHVKHIFSDSQAEDSFASTLADNGLEDTALEAVETGLGMKEDVDNSDKESVDDVSENEQEFSRKLKECTAQMESTMLEEAVAAQQNINATTQEETSTFAAKEPEEKPEEKGEEEQEEEEDFEDAVEAEDENPEDDGNVMEAADDHQPAYSCVSDGLAELEWIDIHVCVAVSASEFWCQLPTARAVLSGSTLGIEKARASEATTDIKVGHLYLVCDPPHANCRARVLAADCDDNDKVTVLKLDYGTEENVPRSCLYPLAKHQLELPAQAFCCCLDDSESAASKKEWLSGLITTGEAVDKELQVKVVGRKPSGTLLVDVREKPSDDGLPPMNNSTSKEEVEVDADASGRVGGSEVSMDTLEISQPALQSTILGDMLSQSQMEKLDTDKDYTVQTLDQGKEYEVTVARGGKPDSFYVTQVSSKGLLDALADDIEAEAKEKSESAAVCELLPVGSSCLVLDDTTSKWVRGLVKSSGDNYKVLCVDSGAVLDIGKECVRELPPRLLDTPAQAVQCCLADVVPVEEQWCEAALTFFTDFIGHSPLKLTVSGLSSDRGMYKVTLSDEQSQSGGDATVNQMGSGPSVNRTLVELGYAEAVAGSPLDVELQVERTINDPDQVDQLEISFSEVSCLRESSIGESSDAEDQYTEEERDVVDAAGDATKAFTTESDEELGAVQPFGASEDDPDIAAMDAGDTARLTTALEDGIVESNTTSVRVCQSCAEDGETSVAVDVLKNGDLMRSSATEKELEGFGEGLGRKYEVSGVARLALGAESGSERSDEYVDVNDAVDAALCDAGVVSESVDVVSSAAPDDGIGPVCNDDDDVQTAKSDPLHFAFSSEPTVTSESTEGVYATAEAPLAVEDGNSKVMYLGDAGDGDDDTDECFREQVEEGQDAWDGALAAEEDQMQEVSSEEEGTADDQAVLTADDMVGITSGRTGDQVKEMTDDEDQICKTSDNYQGSDTKDAECNLRRGEAIFESSAFGSPVTPDTEKEDLGAAASCQGKGAENDQGQSDLPPAVSPSSFNSPVVECPFNSESSPMTEANTAQVYPIPADCEGESRQGVVEGSGHFGRVSEKAGDGLIMPEEDVDPHSSVWENEPSECPLPSSSDESAFDISFRLEKQGEPTQLEMTPSSRPPSFSIVVPGEPNDRPAGTSSPRLPPSQWPFSLHFPCGDDDKPAETLTAEPANGSPASPGAEAEGADNECASEEDSDKQAPDSESLSASASGELLDAQLTADDMEMVAAQLENMAVLEMQQHEDEEAEEHREELTRMIDDYGNSIEPEDDESAGNKIQTDMFEAEVEGEVTPHSLASEDIETLGSRSDHDSSREEEEVVAPQGIMEGSLERSDHYGSREGEVISTHRVLSDDAETPLEKLDHDSGKEEEKADTPQSVVEEDAESQVESSDRGSGRRDENVVGHHSIMPEDTESPMKRSDQNSSRDEEKAVTPQNVTEEDVES